VYAGTDVFGLKSLTVEIRSSDPDKYVVVLYRQYSASFPIEEGDFVRRLGGSKALLTNAPNFSQANDLPYGVCALAFNSNEDATAFVDTVNSPIPDYSKVIPGEVWPPNVGCNSPGLFVIGPLVETRLSNGDLATSDLDWRPNIRTVNFNVKPNPATAGMDIRARYRFGNQRNITITSLPLTIPEGVQTLTVEVADEGGTPLTNNPVITFRTDAQAPGRPTVNFPRETTLNAQSQVVITMIDPIPGSGPKQTQSIATAWFPNDPKCSSNIEWGNSLTIPTDAQFSNSVISGQGQATLPVPVPDTSGENYCLAMWVTDQAGNINYDAWTYNLDRDPPVVEMRVYKQSGGVDTYPTPGHAPLLYTERVTVHLVAKNAPEIVSFTGGPSFASLRTAITVGTEQIIAYDDLSPSGFYSFQPTATDLAGNTFTTSINNRFSLNLLLPDYGPKNIRTTPANTTQTQLTVTWDAPTQIPPAGYRILNADTLEVLSALAASTSRQLTFPSPNSRARVKVQGCETPTLCFDGTLQSNAAQTVLVDYTLAAKVTPIAGTGQPTTILFGWNTNGNADGTAYLAKYREPGAPAYPTFTPHTQRVTTPEVTLINLNSNTRYEVTADAFNGNNILAVPAPEVIAVCTEPRPLQNLTNGAAVSTASSISIKVNINDNNPNSPARRLIVSSNQDLSNPVYNANVTANGDVPVPALSAGTIYYARLILEVPSGCSTTQARSALFQRSTTFSAPSVSANNALSTPTSVTLTVTLAGVERPACALIRFADNTSNSCTLAGSVCKVENLTVSNGRYSVTDVKVGGDASNGCSSASTSPSWTGNVTAFTKVLKPASPPSTPALSVGPTSITAACSPLGSNDPASTAVLQAGRVTTSGVTWPSGITGAGNATCSAGVATINTGLTPGTIYQLRTYIRAQYNIPNVVDSSFDDKSEASGSVATQFAPPTAPTPLTNASVGAVLATANSFAVFIPNNSSNGSRPGAAQVSWQSTAGNGSTIVDFADATVCTVVANGQNCAISVQNLTGAYSNAAFNSITARFMLDTASLGDPSTSGPSPASTSAAYTKADALQSSPNIPVPLNGLITATFQFSPKNAAGTKYFLQATPETTTNTVDWSNNTSLLTSVQSATQGNGSSSLTLTLQTGIQYRARILVVRNQTNIAAGVGPDLANYPNAANGFDAATGEVTPGITPYEKPTVQLSPAALTSNSFNVQIRPFGSQTPSVFIASYTSLGSTSRGESPKLIIAGGDNNAQIITLSVQGVANSSFTFGGLVGDANPQTYSKWVVGTGGLAWTKPEAPVDAPIGGDTNLNYINVSFSAPVANTNSTRYQILYSIDKATIDSLPTHINNPLVQKWPILFTKDGSIPTLTGLVASTDYYVRIRVLSDLGSSNDVYSPTSDAIKTTPPDAVGLYVSRSSTSITASWRSVNTNGAEFVQALAKDSSGNSYFSDPVFPPAFPTLPPFRLPEMRVNLPLANTGYTITLQKFALGTPQPYPNSIVPLSQTKTNAASPIKPGLDISGTNPNFTLVVLADFNPLVDINASDSLYAIEVTKNSEPAKYLDGTGSSALSTTPVELKRDQWTPTALSLANAGLIHSYKVKVCVRQKVISALVCSEVSTIVMPGGGIEASFPALNGQQMDNYLFGVPVAGPFNVNFNGKMLNNLGDFALKVRLLKVSDGSVVPVNFTYTDTPQKNEHTLSINLLNPMDPVTEYQILIDAGLQDLYGFVTTQAFAQKFITGINPGIRTTVFSPVDASRTSAVTVEAGTLQADTVVIPRVFTNGRFANPPSSVTPIGASAASKLIRELKRVEVLFYRLNTGSAASLIDANKSVKLTISPTAIGTNAAGAKAHAGSSFGAGLDLATVGIFKVTPSGLSKVASSTLNADGSVSASITQSGVYVLAAAITTQLDRAFAFPVPFKPSNGDTTITFRNVAPESTIKVYTILGELDQEINTAPDSNGDVVWPGVKNRDGDHVASGVYIYQIKNAYAEKRGKLMVVR